MQRPTEVACINCVEGESQGHSSARFRVVNCAARHHGRIPRSIGARNFRRARPSGTPALLEIAETSLRKEPSEAVVDRFRMRGDEPARLADGQLEPLGDLRNAQHRFTVLTQAEAPTEICPTRDILSPIGLTSTEICPQWDTFSERCPRASNRLPFGRLRGSLGWSAHDEDLSCLQPREP